MSITARTQRRTAPTAIVAAAAALALLATPLPAAGSNPSRTALLTLTGGSSLSEVAQDVASLGGRVLETLGIADSLLVELPAGTSAPTGAAEVPDVAMKVNSTRTDTDSGLLSEPTYLDTINVPDDGSDGDGITVALVDTGVSESVEWLGDVEHVRVSEDEGDAFGHGTFLAGIITGTATHPGVAPGAHLLDIKVADDDGSTSLSNVLSGLQAAADRDADVVNLALSTENPLPPSLDPLTVALDRLWNEGVSVVVSAGNDGPAQNSVGSPGNDPVLLTVGALDESGSPDHEDDVVAEFSSRGSKFSATKPDLVAPGVSILSTAAVGSVAHTRALANGAASGGYMLGSGTSMATAVVAGAVARVLGTNGDLSPYGVKALLTGTAYSTEDLEPRDGAGAGGLDLGSAMDEASSAPVDGPSEKPGRADLNWGPNEDDAAAWADFAAAWEADDFDAVVKAWARLSWQTKQWAARSWSFAVLAASVDLPAEEFAARSWSARSWSLDEWLARSWSARSWSARSWSFEEWLARSWSARSWSARSWSARSWSVDEWLSNAWDARSWSASDWAARSWSARSWSARSWSARSWSARSWSARSWSARSWSARSWSARSWSDLVWGARSWSDLEWEARSWSARSWSARSWSARSWSARSWSARSWSRAS